MRKPNLMIKAYNYLKASSKRLLGGIEDVDTTTYYDRVHTCSRCEYLDDEHYECNLCGCPVDIKAKWKTENSPKGKWKSI